MSRRAWGSVKRRGIKGWGDETAKLYRVNSTPSTWLIDRQGILRGVNLSGDTLTKAIVALL